MVKKTLHTKVLKELDEGCTVREVRNFDSKTGKVTSSSMSLFRAKKQIKGGFKTVEEVIKYFNEEVAKR